VAGPRRSYRGRLTVAPFTAFQYGILIAVVLVADLPLVWIVVTAFRPDQDLTAYPPLLFPSRLTFDHFRHLFTSTLFGTYFVNSAFVASTATLLTMVVGTMGAYTIARFQARYVYLRALAQMSLLAYLVPPILLLVPITQIIGVLGLANNLTALVLVYSATLLLPFALWILRSYFHGVSAELEEAAMVDGCTRFGAFRRVVLPQAASGLITTAVFTFNAAWQEYLYASILLSDPKSETLSFGVSQLVQADFFISWGQLMAASVIITIPVIVLFTIAQRQLVGGIGSGAVKG
jgi:ABC-type glycerol-3-phosphate transport system permease component